MTKSSKKMSSEIQRPPTSPITAAAESVSSPAAAGESSSSSAKALQTVVIKNKRLIGASVVFLFIVVMVAMAGSLDVARLSTAGSLGNTTIAKRGLLALSPAELAKGSLLSSSSASPSSSSCTSEQPPKSSPRYQFPSRPGPAFARGSDDTTTTASAAAGANVSTTNFKRDFITGSTDFEDRRGSTPIASFTFVSSRNESDSFAELLTGTKLYRDAIRCRQEHKHKFFDYSSGKCVEYPRVKVPLQEGEISPQELTCSSDSLYEEFYRHLRKQQKQQQQQQKSRKEKHYRPGWRTHAFSEYFPPNSTLERFGLGGGLSPEIRARYSRFAFFSSWLFRQYLPFAPLPESGGGDKEKSNAFSAFHDQKTENVYRMKNVCLSPTRGLYGFLSGGGATAADEPQVPGEPAPADDSKRAVIRKYRGRDDTITFHAEPTWPTFIKNVRQIPRTASVVFDQRPMFFVFPNPLARHNMAHISFRFYSLLGMLDLPVFGNTKSAEEQEEENVVGGGGGRGGGGVEGEFAPGSGTSHWTGASGIKPLLVFVFAEQPSGYDEAGRKTRDVQITTSWAFLLRVLDLPWAVTLTNSNLASGGSRTVLAELYRLTKHKGELSNAELYRNITDEMNSSSSSSSGARELFGSSSDDDFICSRKAVVWSACVSNCGKGSFQYPDNDGGEEYAWTDWNFLTPSRQRAVGRYLRLLENCVPPPPRLHSITPAAAPLPRLLILIRTRSRAIANFNLIFSRIVEQLNGTFVSDIAVKEQGVGSRRSYVEDMRATDILLALHGGSEAELVLMGGHNKVPVVIELQAPFQACGPERPNHAGCWFSPFSQAIGATHHVVQFARSLQEAPFVGRRPEKQLFVPAHVLVDAVRGAGVCNFFAKNPSSNAAMPPAVRAYCSREGGHARRFRSHSLVRVGPTIAVDVAEVQVFLRSMFGISMDRAGIDMVMKRLLGLREGRAGGGAFDVAAPSSSRNRPGGGGGGPGSASEYILYLESDLPILFLELLQRFVDYTLVGHVVPTARSKAVAGSDLGMAKMVAHHQQQGAMKFIRSGGKNMPLLDVACLRKEDGMLLCLRAAWLLKMK